MFNTFVSKPFKFESFKDREEAQAYFNKHYPIGSDFDILFKNLKKVGVRYIKERERIPPKEMGKGKEDLIYDKVYVSEYANNWISEDPMGVYVLFIHILDNGKIVDILVKKLVKFT